MLLGLAFNRPTLVFGVVAIAVTVASGVLAAAGQPGGPLEGAFWIAPVVAGITALAALVKESAPNT
jgi:hypothetical protein